MRATKDVILRQIAGENILIPVGKLALQLKGMMSLSESGLLLWNRLQSDCTADDLVNALLSEYEVDRMTAQQDVDDFLKQMNDVGILEDFQ
ncbi:MAG: PqqD family protein [Eubacteriales bacterium]